MRGDFAIFSGSESSTKAIELDLPHPLPYAALDPAMNDSSSPIAPEAPPAAAKRAVDDKTQLSPAMRQYQQFKTQCPGYVLFFRMGDFYEMFWEDAQLAAKVLGVAL